jgi:hypothetical protein
MENKIESVEVVQTPAQTALFLITKAEIDTQIATAKAFPRSITEFMRKAESLATVNEDVAASCNYAVPRGGKNIEGPSVRFAEIVVSAYGNIRAGARVIDNDGKWITAQGICHDLEANNSVTVEVKRKITGKDGRTFNEDMQTLTGNAACAIAYRNAIYKVIPAALVEGIYEKTKEVARGKAETMVKRRDKALEYAKGLGITPEQISTVLNIKNVEDIDLDKLATFRGILTGIKNGDSTVAEIFEKPTQAEKVEQSQQDHESERYLSLIKAADSIEKLTKLQKELKKYKQHEQAYLDRINELETPKGE